MAPVTFAVVSDVERGDGPEKASGPAHSRADRGHPGTSLDFSGRVVIVTGGVRGVGRAIAEAFLSAGAQVVVCGRHRADPAELPRAVPPGGGERMAAFLPADVREPEQAQRLIEGTTERFGRLDVLVNNAGGSPYVPSADVSPRLVASVIALNLLAPFYCAQAANAVLQQGDGGSIVNIGSVSGIRPSPGTAAYGAAKAGLVSLTGSLALEWAPKVRVNCLTAGLLDTGSGTEHYGGAEGMARVAATVPLGARRDPDRRRRSVPLPGVTVGGVHLGRQSRGPRGWGVAGVLAGCAGKRPHRLTPTAHPAVEKNPVPFSASGGPIGHDLVQLPVIERSPGAARGSRVAAGGTHHRPWDPDGPTALAGEPRLVYQPVIDLLSGRVLGFEALLRWEHPTEGPILPQLLIPWAEANGDIVILGEWVLAEGCRQAVDWPPSVQLAVNCSIVQLRRGAASRSVLMALEQSGLTPDRLTVEVTEHALSEEGASAELRTIAGLGVQLAVDDVGTSWNSFELLRKLAINTIKIDESFVSGLEDNEGINRMVVETVIHLAHSSGMSTVAEGVETAKHASIVREFESDAAQGYFFAPPLDADSATRVANMADLAFPLDGPGWADDDGWPFPEVRSEGLGVGNTLSHARHARTEETNGTKKGVDLTGLVLPGLPDTSPGAGRREPSETGEAGEEPSGTATEQVDPPAAGPGDEAEVEAEPEATADPELPDETSTGEGGEPEHNGTDPGAGTETAARSSW